MANILFQIRLLVWVRYVVVVVGARFCRFYSSVSLIIYLISFPVGV